MAEQVLGAEGTEWERQQCAISVGRDGQRNRQQSAQTFRVGQQQQQEGSDRLGAERERLEVDECVFGTAAAKDSRLD